MTLIEMQELLGERMSALCKGGISQKKLKQEIERSKGVAALASQMIRNANTVISAKKNVGDLDKSFTDAFVGNT
jgi:hypothetical protein